MLDDGNTETLNTTFVLCEIRMHLFSPSLIKPPSDDLILWRGLHVQWFQGGKLSQEIADRGDVIIVSVGYCVGTLGFLSTGDSSFPGK